MNHINNCPHINVIFGMSHTDYLGFCNDCQEEITEAEVEASGRELLREHVESEVLEEQLRELNATN